MKTVAIIQARMSSTRLPGKVLMLLAGQAMLARIVCRVQRAETVDLVAVATSVAAEDNAIADLCAAHSWQCVRGSLHDVLDRYHQAVRQLRADIIVRVTSDCPFVDPAVLDKVVKTMKSERADYCANDYPAATFPRGLDVEAMTSEALERAWQEDANPAWREHVTPYLYRHPERFALGSVVCDEDYSALRWTVDTPEDLCFARNVYQAFGHDTFSWQEVLALLACHPEWVQINSHVPQKSVDGAGLL